MKATKPKRLKFISLMTNELLSIGAVKTVNDNTRNTFDLDTLYGKLIINIFGEDDHEQFYSVYTRFETPKSVPNTIEINRHSGKWNHYVPTNIYTPNEAVGKLMEKIKNLL